MDTAAKSRYRRYAEVSSKRPWIILLVLAMLALAIWGAWALTHGVKDGGPAGQGGGCGRRGGHCLAPRKY